MLLVLSQSIYMDKILKQFSMKESKKGYLPISYVSPRICVINTNSYTMDIRFIIYAMLFTKPDVFYALSIINKYQSNSIKSHQKILKNIFKYFRKNNNVFLVYEGDKLIVYDYLNVSFQSNIENSKSNGIIFYSK